MTNQPSGNLSSIATRVLNMRALMAPQADPAVTVYAFNDLLARAKILAAFCLCPAELPLPGKRPVSLASEPGLGEPVEFGAHDEDRDGPVKFDD